MGSIGAKSSSSAGVTNTNDLGTKTPLYDIEDYQNYDDYAGELAMVSEGSPVYQIEYNGGRAFADVSEDAMYDGELYITYLASTGKGAGTELLARLGERALKNNWSLTWVADQQSAVDYYSHLNVGKYGTVTKYPATVGYEVTPNQLPAFIKSLRRR